MKRIIGILTALVLLLTCCFGASAFAESAAPAAPSAKAALTLEDIQALNGGGAVIDERNGTVTFVGGTCAAGPVQSSAAAAEVVESMIPLLGGDSRTAFEPWRTLYDSFGNTYYVFQQVYADTLVQGGAAKVITDREGNMLGLTGSVVSDLPDAQASSGISAADAEQLVLIHEKGRGIADPAVIEGVTKKIVLPVDRELDLEADEIPTRFVWVVCTPNPSVGGSSDMPYLAHYVTLSGEYLYSLPTLLPGDSAANAGYDAEYFFENMESVPYTGYVDFSDGTEKEITVSVMRDKTTGTYYLGNPEHKILVADCWEFLYNSGNIVPETSPDNREWDQVSLLSLYNYCRACDYYKALGWHGGDGDDTPLLILKDFCDKDHNPVNNAAYAGKFYGWQCFLSSSANDFAQCLDVIAHEFTHCVTGSAMTYNAYLNDFGAINEAVSDIQGNLCEMLLGDTEDQTWIIGEHSTESIRHMSDPHRGHQPAYTWDLYYHSAVKDPTDINDQGGVHSNSSLLSRVAYLLWKGNDSDGGMTLEEGRAYWFAVDCAMVPGSDYAQLKVLLPWVLEITGLDRLQGVLADALAETRLGESEMPAVSPENYTLLTLSLPDTPSFNDGKWALSVLSVNTDAIRNLLTTVAEDLQNGNTEGYPKMLVDLFAAQQPAGVPDQAGADDRAEMPSFLEILLGMLLSGELSQESLAELPPETPEETAQENADLEELITWVRERFSELFYYGSGSAGQDGHTVRMMTLSGRAIPTLMYVDLLPNSDQIRKMNVAVFLRGRWIDATPILAPLLDAEHPEVFTAALEFLKTGLLTDLLDDLFSGRSVWDFLKSLTCELPGGRAFALPAEGLESINLEANMASPAMTPPVETNNRMSRPKAEGVWGRPESPQK